MPFWISLLGFFLLFIPHSVRSLSSDISRRYVLAEMMMKMRCPFSCKPQAVLTKEAHRRHQMSATAGPLHLASGVQSAPGSLDSALLRDYLPCLDLLHLTSPTNTVTDGSRSAPPMHRPGLFNLRVRILATKPEVGSSDALIPMDMSCLLYTSDAADD